MTIQEACEILGVTKQEDDKRIKLQFRKLMTKYHPDAVGSDAPEHIKKAQRINEAYTLLRKRTTADQEEVVKRTVWKGKINNEAFTERIIYVSVTWEEYGSEYYEVAKGRYEWDPELEEFECFLKSLNQVVMELLEKAEYKNEIYNDYGYDRKARRFDYQLQLFHLLAHQFVSPVSCLKKLAEPEQIDGQGRTIYQFQAFLGTKGSGAAFSAMSKLKSGDFVYATSLKNNRIYVSDAAGTMLGHLSFADDQLYYVIIPILQNHMAQVKFVVREIEVHRRTRPYRVKVNVDLYLRMEDVTKEVTLSGHNEKIVALLKEYDDYLKTVTTL